MTNPTNHTISPPSRRMLNHVNTCNLWHLHLGHPSKIVLSQINKKFPSQNYTKNTLPGDGCFMAKQKRLPLNNKHSHDSNCFFITHMDIWGPYAWF